MDGMVVVPLSDDQTKNFRLLANGELDAIIADTWNGGYVLAKHKIDGVAKDVRTEMTSVRETLGGQFAALTSANTRVIAEYSMLLGELKGEAKARRKALEEG